MKYSSLLLSLCLLLLGGLTGCGKPAPQEEDTTPNAPREPKRFPVDTARLNEELLQTLNFGDEARAEMLLTQGADPETPDRYGHPVLFLAARQGKTIVLKAPIEAGADENATLSRSYNTDGVGYTGTADGTPLTYAAGAGQLEAAKILVRAGADINGAGPGGTTALMAAAENGHTDMVAWLLENGATSGRQQALDLARRIFNPSPDVQKMITLLGP